MAKSHSTALQRIEILGAISDREGQLVRTFLSPANRRAAMCVLDWMGQLGMTISHARDGTIRGILPGSNPLAKPLLLGSHLDTVIDAGKYDGALGIIAALAALEALAEENAVLPYPVHVLGFSDEEGTRFHTTYLGSRAVVGALDEATLQARDANGISLRQCLESEGWDEGAEEILYTAGGVLGYVELHIEQGRVLESYGEAACAVAGISGQSRLSVTLTGRADHAGTTPMALRRDALAGAAACILAAESLACSQPPLVITVGKIEVHPGASNSVPQSATFTIDLRHPEDEARRNYLKELHDSFSKIAADRQLALEWIPVQDSDAVACDPMLTRQLLEALHDVTATKRLLHSGAGHDAVALTTLGPVAMIFVRCRDGLSHHPDEYASPEDIATGIEVLTRFLKNYA